MIKRLLLVCLLCSFALPAWSKFDPEQFTLSPMIGEHVFEGNQRLDSSLHFGLALGYNFTEKWSGEAVVTMTDANARKTWVSDTQVWTYRLDALYHLTPLSENLVPYLAAGFGGLAADPAVGSLHRDHLLFNYGGGVKYFVNNNQFALRADVRHLVDIPKPYSNLQWSFGLVFPLGKKAAAPQPMAAEPVAKPVVANDSDSDGVADQFDNCKNTPLGVEVDANGCPVDSDKDGVSDYLDACPATPQNIQVDKRGCPRDSDSDGVADHMDKCPGTPEGVSVDANGCPASLTLQINFGTNSSVITPEYDAEVAKAAQCIDLYPGSNVYIDGHTDNAGSNDYNMKLSENRAKAVMQRLIDKFNIKPYKLEARWYGEENPVASNDTPEGMFENRRVEVGCGVK